MMDRGCQAVGIDLGTTYSALAYVDSQLRPHIVPDSEGNPMVVPSVISFADGDPVVGHIALDHAKEQADLIVQFVKVHMGTKWTRYIGGRDHTPESLSAIILAHLVREAQAHLGPIPGAVITVPAYFDEKRRFATEQAGQIAGLKVIGTLNEPTAAALASGLHLVNKPENVVVYDLGGGTFDVTVLRASPGEVEELATFGNRQLGGKDWDERLIRHVVADFQRAYGRDPTTSLQTMQDLWLECEYAKRKLSRVAQTKIKVVYDGTQHYTEISRDKFRELTADLLQMTRLTTELALGEKGLTWKDVAKIVLVGGSTNMPMVRDMLKEISGITPEFIINPVLAVAIGAATYAHLLESGQAIRTIAVKPTELELSDKEPPPPVIVIPPVEARATAPVASDNYPASPADNPEKVGTLPKVRFVTAHGVGVQAYSKKDGTVINSVLIHRNVQVPARQTKRFATRGKGQKILIVVTQGDTRDPRAAEILGNVSIEGLPANEPDGQPVDVTLRFDEQGRLNVGATYVNTGKSLDVILEVQGGLRAEEIRQYQSYLEQTGLIPRQPLAVPAIDLFTDDIDAILLPEE